MNGNVENEEIFESVCDSVRFAISVGDELTEEQKKHLDECDECRTFFEQSKIMSEELAAMGSISLTKNGKSLADSVMEEIARQELFTKGPAKKPKFAFLTKHAGLIAAGIALVIMAVPLMQNMLNSKKKDYITLAGTGGKDLEQNAVMFRAKNEPSEASENAKLYAAFMSPAENNEATAPAPEADYDADSPDMYYTYFEEPEADAEEASDESQDYYTSDNYSEKQESNSGSKSQKESETDKNDAQYGDDAVYDGSAYVAEDVTTDSMLQSVKPSFMMPQNSASATESDTKAGTSDKEILATETVMAYLTDKSIDYSVVLLETCVENGNESQYTFTAQKTDGECINVIVLIVEENGVFVVKDVFEG